MRPKLQVLRANITHIGYTRNLALRVFVGENFKKERVVDRKFLLNFRLRIYARRLKRIDKKKTISDGVKKAFAAERIG